MSQDTVRPARATSRASSSRPAKPEGFGDPVLVLERQPLAAAPARPLQLDPYRVQEIAGLGQAVRRPTTAPTQGSRRP